MLMNDIFHQLGMIFKGYLDLWQFSGDPIPLLPQRGPADYRLCSSSKFDRLRRAGEGDDVANISHASHELHQTIKAQAKTGVGNAAVAA